MALHSSDFRYEYILRSARHEVHFSGFKSDTLKLQNSGWELAAEQDYTHCTINLILRHQDTGLKALCETQDFNFRDIGRHVEFRDRPLVFMVRRMAPEMRRQTPVYYMPHFELIDARSSTTTAQAMIESDDFSVFNKLSDKAESIIVDPATVEEYMDAIKKLQAPTLARIRSDQRRRDGEFVRQKPMQIHGQILTFA